MNVTSATNIPGHNHFLPFVSGLGGLFNAEARDNRTFRHSSFVMLLVVWLAAFSLQGAEPDASAMVSGANQLIERVIPRQAKQFVVEIIPSADGRDVFEIEGRDGKIVLRSNNGVAVASALNRYLKDFCFCDISWDCGDQLKLPNPLPMPPEKVRAISPHRFRFAFNYCTHGYTMAWWPWERWEHELDVLALNGVNLALVIEGQEQVWVNTLKDDRYLSRPRGGVVAISKKLFNRYAPDALRPMPRMESAK